MAKKSYVDQKFKWQKIKTKNFWDCCKDLSCQKSHSYNKYCKHQCFAQFFADFTDFSKIGKN